MKELLQAFFGECSEQDNFCDGKWAGPRPGGAVWSMVLLSPCCTTRSDKEAGCKTLADKCFSVPSPGSVQCIIYSDVPDFISQGW